MATKWSINLVDNSQLIFQIFRKNYSTKKIVGNRREPANIFTNFFKNRVKPCLERIAEKC